MSGKDVRCKFSVVFFFFSSLSVPAVLICTGCVLSFQCSNGTLTYIQSKCQEALSNLHTDPETGSHSLLALLPTTIQRCEEIHNEVGGVSSHTCTSESVSKSFAALLKLQLSLMVFGNDEAPEGRYLPHWTTKKA